MRMSTLLASSAVALSLAALTATSASAATFTWSPLGGGLSTTGAFTASNITVNDYAKIDISNLANVTESAILSVQTINASTPGLVNTSGVTGGYPDPYALYFTVTATSQLSGTPTILVGTFTSLTYQLWGDPVGDCTFATLAGGPLATCSSPSTLLAHGSLINNSTNTVDIINGHPAAFVDVTIVSDNAGFWVAPANLTSFLFDTAFSNNLAEAFQVGTVFYIGGSGALANPNCSPPTGLTVCPGAGTLSFLAVPVPEPVTLSMFGAGLVGAAALRRRKAKKA
jgi:hypothetical protein